MLGGVVAPLGGVHVDKVHQRLHIAQAVCVLGHGAAENDDSVEANAAGRLVHPALQSGIPVVGQAQGLTGEQAAQAQQLGSARVEAG
ncbi:hypothetical protein DBR42_24010, partial [Pelomonas sp. HMWF004]